MSADSPEKSDAARAFFEAETFAPGLMLAGRYRVEREVGRGGMGAVFLAHDTFLGADVAVKLLPALLVRDQAAMERLKAEARIAMRLGHPNIARVHTLEESPQGAFLVMEYVEEGRTLKDLIQERGKLTLEDLLPIAEQVAAGLDYAHAQAVLHRDIKPSNVLLKPDGTAKVSDFGIAREMTEAAQRLTGQGTSGTPLYMSPEQMLGRPLDARSDIYSFGALLYECLGGHPPFASGHIPMQILSKRPPDVEGVSPGVNAALQQALAKTPADRPEGAEALVVLMRQGADLSALTMRRAVVPSLRGEGEPPAGTPESAPKGDPAGVGEPVLVNPSLRRSLSGRRWLLAAGVGVVGVLVLQFGLRFRVSPAPPRLSGMQVAAAREAQVEPYFEVDLGGGVKMGMVLVPAGKFPMGSPPYEEGRKDDEIQHDVEIAGPFYIGATEVTQAQYEMVTRINPSRSQGADLPVENVTWEEAASFCRRLTEIQRERGPPKSSETYRLPTEAEWEYACRAGSITRYCSGDDEGGLSEYSWHAENAEGESHPVARKKPNVWGLHDMHGNLFEWCSDWHGPYRAASQVPPGGPDRGSERVLRGGSWSSPPEGVRSAKRYGFSPGRRLIDAGFRCVRTISPALPLDAVLIPPPAVRAPATRHEHASPDR